MARGLVSALAVFLFGLGIVLVGRIGVRKVVKSSGSNCVLAACADGVGDVLDICNARVADAVSGVVGQDESRSSSIDGSSEFQPSIQERYYADLAHGPKGPEFQKYIVLHDTEVDSSPESVIDWWESNGNKVAAHFVVGKDGSIVQCVPLDQIAHHAGFGDAGKNEQYGTIDDSRDDKVGTLPIGGSYPDYGMNSYSVGIEMVHVGGSGDYPEEQLIAVDGLIAYIDEYYGFKSQIIDHKAWRTGNSDTSAEFSSYLSNYQEYRRHVDG